MKYGYWQPISNGWLRHIEDEEIPTLASVEQIARTAEKLQFDAAFIPDMYLYQGKNAKKHTMDFWSAASCVADSTSRLHIMAAVRPSIDDPIEAAKMAVKIDKVSDSRFSLAVVSFWREEEERRRAGDFNGSEDLYLQTEEFLEVIRGFWTNAGYSYDGLYYKVNDEQLEQDHPNKIISPLYAGGESDYVKQTIAESCDAYVMKGGTVQEVASTIADMQIRRERAGKTPLTEFGMVAYIICRDTEQEAFREWGRITGHEGSADFKSYDDFITQTELKQKGEINDFAVSAQGLRPNLIGTPEQIAQRILAYEHAGVNLLLLQFSPQQSEMERFAKEVMPLVERMRETSI